MVTSGKDIGPERMNTNKLTKKENPTPKNPQVYAMIRSNLVETDDLLVYSFPPQFQVHHDSTQKIEENDLKDSENHGITNHSWHTYCPELEAAVDFDVDAGH